MKDFNSSGELIIQDATITEPGSPVNKSYVDSKIDQLPNSSEVEEGLAAKADTTYVDSELAEKADTTYVDSELSKKSNLADLVDGLNAIRQQETQELDGTAWAHVTESGQRLPLGYAPDGSLDEHARTAWDREVNGVSVARDDGVYTHVSTSENGALIWGIRSDGAVEIPGLRAPQSGYEVYERDGEILPANVDTTQLASWGSSSMEFMQEQMRGQASRYGVIFHGHGKGAEDGYQTAARLGSRPALMTAAGGVINASGATELSSSNVNPAAAMLPYAATIAGVEGLITPEATRFVFARTHPGVEVAIEADTPAIPVAGHARRSDMTILNLGKNMVGKRAGAGAEIIELMDEAFAWLAPQKKRVLMIGHFANTGTPATGMYRDQINEVNNYLRRRYGRVFVDFEKFVTTSLVFDYLGTTPTQEDIAEQNLGNIPPGASNDGAHLHVAGRDAFARYLFDFMADLGWI